MDAVATSGSRKDVWNGAKIVGEVYRKISNSCFIFNSAELFS
jgi:hypothetical protein